MLHWNGSRRLTTAVVAFALLAVGGCDPCSGVGSCTDEPRFVVIGQLVQAPNGKPAPGAVVDVRLSRDGAEIAHQRIVANGDGLWELRVHAGDEPAIADVWIVASPTDSFAVPPFQLHAVTVAGDATILPPWFVRPYTNHLRSVITWDGRTLVGATVRFTPTGGVAPPDAAVWTGSTNGVGAFEMPFFGTAVGDAIGELVITHPDLGYTAVFPDYRVPVGWVFSMPVVLGTFVL